MVPDGVEAATFAATPVKRQACAPGRCVLSTGNTSYIAVPGPRGGVVTQRTANPRTPVQFRAWPPAFAPVALRLASHPGLESCPPGSSEGAPNSHVALLCNGSRLLL